MKVTIEGSSQEIAELLQAIASSKEQPSLEDTVKLLAYIIHDPNKLKVMFQSETKLTEKYPFMKKSAEDLIMNMLDKNKEGMFKLIEVDGTTYKIEIEKYESTNAFLKKANAALKKIEGGSH